MDLKRLRTFIAVAEENGFARAAERLSLAQPAVSKHIKDLEDRFGEPLLERRPDGVRPTYAGTQLLNGARDLITVASELEARVKAATRGDAGVLCLGFNETVSWGSVIPKAVYEFGRRHPNVKLTMQPMISVDQIAALHAKRIDGGFLFHRDVADGELTGIPVLVDPMLLAVPRRSKWAKHPPSRLADLADEPFIWIPRHVAPAYYDQIISHCQKAGLQLEIVQEAMDGSALLSLVAVGMGLSFVPAAARPRCPDDVALVTVPDLTVELTLEFVWRAGEDHSALARFIEITREITVATMPSLGARERCAAS
jgi:DNA-binding transcriptional LysR family regulator